MHFLHKVSTVKITIGSITHLFLEVTNRKFIGKCEEVKHIVFEVVILQVIHQVCSVTLIEQK